MTGEVENLVLEHLRAIRADMAKMAEDIRGFRTEMVSMRQPLAGIMTLQELDQTDIAAIKVRLDRIERRLELVD